MQLKKYSKILLSAFMSLILFLGMSVRIHASTFNMSASNNGDGTTTVTVSGNVVGGIQVTVGGITQNVYINDIGGSASAKFNTGAGTFDVYATAISLSDANYQLVGGEASTTVTVTVPQTTTPNNGNSGNTGGSTSQAPTTNQSNKDENNEEKELSNNANLSSLSVSSGTLSPKFSASKTQYTVNLTGNVSKIKISAKAADSKASVYGTGEQSVKAGKNTLTVSVVAEDGTQKDYVITVNVDETPLVYTSYNGTKLGFVRSLDGVDKPGKSFEETTLKIDGKDVSAWKSNLMNKTIVYLQNDETKEKNYYLYNTETNTVESKIQPMAILGNNVFVVDIPENLQKREGMTFTKVTIDKYELNGWKFNDKAFENYALIYVMNEKGEMVYYQYESTENTLQLYSEAASITQEAYDAYKTDMDNKVKTYTWIMYGLGAGCVVLLAGCIVLVLRKKNTLKYAKQEISVKGNDAESEALRNISNEE